MDQLTTLLPVALVAGSGYYLYSQCVAPSGAKDGTSKKTVVKNTPGAVDDGDDSDSENSFLTKADKKKLAEKQRMEAEQQKLREKQQAKKAADRKKQEDAAAKAAAEKEAKALAAQDNNKTSPQQQQQQKGGKKAAPPPPQPKKQMTKNQQQQSFRDKQNKATNQPQQQQQQQQTQKAKANKLSEEDEIMLAFVTKDFSILKQKPAAAPAAAAKKVDVKAKTEKKLTKAEKKEQKEKELREQEQLEADLADGWVGVKTKGQKEKERREMAKYMAESDITRTEYEDLTGGDGDENVEDLTEQVELPKKEERVTITMPFQWEKRFIIIGKEGDTITQIREKTNTWISLPKEEDLKKDLARQVTGNYKVYVKIEGPQRGCDLAKKIINELLTKGYSPTLVGGGPVSEHNFKLEPVKRPLILGEKGHNIKAIEQAYGVKIMFPERASPQAFVKIVGPKPQVEKTKKVFKALLETGFSHITHPTWIKQEFPLAFQFRRRVIGRAGQIIKQIQRNTKCKLVFPQESDDERIFIIGERSNIPAAAKAITKIVEQVHEEQARRDETRARGSDDEYDDYDDEDWEEGEGQYFVQTEEFEAIPDEEEEEQENA